MGDVSENSRWARSEDVAVRGDGRVFRRDGVWCYVRGRRLKRLSDAADLESAIVAADVFDPPGLWSWDSSRDCWTRPGWEVREGDEGWEVWRTTTDAGEMVPASVMFHASADRARRWAELRLDRTGANLRGPPTRSSAASTAKLPNIRVTPAERDAARAILKQLDISYSDFVRAALAFAEEHLDGGGWCVVKTPNGTAFRLRLSETAPEEALDELVD
jgi:hypothetical protein